VDQPPVGDVVVGDALLVSGLIHDPLQGRIQVLLAAAAHGVAVHDLLLLHVDAQQRPVRVAQVDGRDHLVHLEHVELLRPALDVSVVVFVLAAEQLREEERVEEPGGQAGGVCGTERLVALLQHAHVEIDHLR
jgi:uncharacterized protein (DUF952 family)